MKPGFRFLSALVLMLSCLGIASGHDKSSKPKRPNIIFIMADDLGYGDIGCYGQKFIKTPNIDRLAKAGLRFTQVYAGAAVCSPSRSVLMTGLHTGLTRVRGNHGKRKRIPASEKGQKNRVPLEPEDMTIAEVLKAAGYVTGIIGKWGLGEPGSTGVPNKQGFDEWLGFLNNDRADWYYTPYLWHNGKKFQLKGNQSRKGKHYTTDVLTNYALKFIRKNKDRPFFLYLPYTCPHARYQVPDLGIYAKKNWKEKEKVYAAMITRMDRGIGEILDSLDQLGLSENTIVFFTSDNGASRAVIGWRFGSVPGFRGYKGSLHEGGLRVPMIVRWPGRIRRGVNKEAVWYFADVLPTLADIGNAKAPKKTSGVSVLPTLLDKKQDLANRFLYWEQPYGGLRQAARKGDWKAIRVKKNGPVKLYNLARDVKETRDVARENPQIVQMFERYFSSARTESPNWPVRK